MIGYAEKHNNQHRVEGLKKGAERSERNCSDSQLRADHQKKIGTEGTIAERHA